MSSGTEPSGTTAFQKLYQPIIAGYYPAKKSHKNDVNKLYLQLATVLDDMPIKTNRNLDAENTDRFSEPPVWVTGFTPMDVDDFGYILNNKDVGLLFNDTEKLIKYADGGMCHIDANGNELFVTENYCHCVAELTDQMEKISSLAEIEKLADAEVEARRKVGLEHCMKERLVLIQNDPADQDAASDTPHLHTWFRTANAYVLLLTNGVVQIRFSDKVTIVLCPRMKCITQIARNTFSTYTFSTIRKSGCSHELYEKLRYGRELLKKLLEKLD